MRQPEAGAVAVVTTPDGVRVAVHEWGDPDGPEVLLLHGVGQSHLCFARQWGSDLARSHRLVAYDVRGHGGSDKPLAAEHYSDGRRWADEVQAVMDARDLRRPVAVGWSLGGRILVQYLAHYGDGRLAGLNLVGSRLIPDTRFSGPGSLAVPTVDPRDAGAHIAMAEAFLRACYHVPMEEADFARALAYNMLAPAEVRSAIRAWRADPAAAMAALRNVRVPTLLTHGRRDQVVLPAVTELAAATIPGAEVSWFEDCGHAPFWEDAPRFNRELAAFVARTRTRS